MQTFSQGSIASIQHSNGLHNISIRYVELRGDGHDSYPLERASPVAAGVSDFHRSAHGARVHKILARVDNLGCASCYFYLG